MLRDSRKTSVGNDPARLSGPSKGQVPGTPVFATSPHGDRRGHETKKSESVDRHTRGEKTTASDEHNAELSAVD